jgi:hypothetical protein
VSHSPSSVLFVANDQAKPGKKEVVTIAKFREDAGVMMPGIWCKGHEMEGRVIYDMNDVDPEQHEVSNKSVQVKVG